jgi:hypothetical protein
METEEHRLKRLKKMREYMKEIRKTDKYKTYRKSKAFMSSQAQYVRKWRNKNKSKYTAHNLVGWATRFANKAKQPCEVCGKVPAHGHHDDYSKPLEVRWLCPYHHAEYHRKLRST